MTELQHFGIKGMRWGHRRSLPDASRPSKMTRKERRANIRAQKDKFYEDKANRIWDAASNTKLESLIYLRSSPMEPPMVVSGKEYITHLSNGGYMDLRYTDVYATQKSKNGQFVINDQMNARFKPKR